MNTVIGVRQNSDRAISVKISWSYFSRKARKDAEFLTYSLFVLSQRTLRRRDLEGIARLPAFVMLRAPQVRLEVWTEGTNYRSTLRPTADYSGFADYEILHWRSE